jgi:hypothetical protein
MLQHFASKDSKMEEKKTKKQKKKKFTIDIKNMGVNIDKNEYREIVLSNSNHPEIFKR